MVQGGHGPRFLFEAAEPVGIGGDVEGDDLDRHIPAQAGVAGPVDLAHPARADRREDLVGAESRAGSECGGARRRARHGSRSVRVEAVPASTLKVMRTRPSRISSPSRSGATEASLSPRTYVPFLLPRSSRVAFLPDTTMRA